MDASGTKPSNLILILGIALAFLFYPVFGIFVHPGVSYTAGGLFYSRLVIWSEVLVLYLYAAKIEKGKYLLWAEQNYRFKFYIASFFGLYGLALATGLVANSFKLLGMHDSRAIMNNMMLVLDKNLPLLLFSAVTAGVTEELIFRAYLVPRLQLLFKNDYAAIIISSLMFGVIHYKYHSFVEVIFATLFGIIFALHYKKYHNIRILMFTHAMVDLITFLVFKVAIAHHTLLK